MKLSKAYQEIIRITLRNIAKWTECLKDAIERRSLKDIEYWCKLLDTERGIIERYAKALIEIESGELEDKEIQ